jgi:hypothetical protein
MPFASMGGEWHSPHHFVPFASTGGECTPSASHSQPPTGATQYGCQGLMVPLPVTSGAARPSPNLAFPFLLTWSSPTHLLPMMGGSAALAACSALAWAHPAYSAPPSPFADKLTLLVVQVAYPIYQLPAVPGCKELAANKKAAMNAVVSALQLWY